MIPHRRTRTSGMSRSEAAAYWAERQEGEMTPTEQETFARWHDDHPANAQAFARVMDTYSLLDAYRDHDPTLRALRQSALSVAPARRLPLRLVTISGVAVASLAAVFLFVHAPTKLPNPAGPVETASMDAAAPLTRATDYAGGNAEIATKVGERRTARLADGSRVTLDTNSRIIVAFAHGSRTLRLVQGQALFEVAHDAARPFIVKVYDRQVRALGTIFQVRAEMAKVNVVLVRGRVAIEQSDKRPGMPPIAPAILSPGEEFVAELGTPQVVHAVDVGEQTMWRNGFVAFEDVSLREAVSEINRYIAKPVIVGDDAAAMRISGVFETGSADRFVAAASAVLPLRSHINANGYVQLSAAEKGPDK